MRENHPFFDRPLFTVGRDSNIRRICQNIVDAKYSPERIDSVTGKPLQLKYKQIRSLFGLMNYLDWAMVLVTGLSCISMLFESPWPTTGEYLIFHNPYLQIFEYIFVMAMTFELCVKIIANGLFFTPKAVVRDVGDIMTIFIYIVSFFYAKKEHFKNHKKFLGVRFFFAKLQDTKFFTVVIIFYFFISLFFFFLS